MCRICDGNPPDPLGFKKFEGTIIRASQNVGSSSHLISEAVRMDGLRFETGDEWGEPHLYQDVKRFIFSNSDPNEGLLLFTLSCWLDMQAAFTTVWTTYLRQAKSWINGEGPVPRGNYSHTTKHLLLTKEAIQTRGSIGQWFVQKINEIAERHGRESGNVYRLAGEICNDLYFKPDAVNSLRYGILPDNFSGGDHKRFWMFMMFLRRDNSVIRCLFTRALSKFDAGQQAVRYWYDSEYFNPIECELPVDRRVSANWNSVFGRLGVSDLQTKYTWNVARKARSIARRNSVSPSVFDAILFYSGIE